MVTKNYTFLFLLIGGFLLCFLEGNARHIIGGEITYECLGNGTVPNSRNYRITMRIYRDCQGQGADFDSPAEIGIYSQTGIGYNFIRSINASLTKVSRINPEDDPCVEIPPNVCVEEGLYIFDVENLPILANGSYHFSWQRCCRNNSINNIVNPESTGATFTVEISSEAQKVCNNSPTFKNFPPTVICVNQNLFFDHSAIDDEGDLLVYEFCAPLRGGGTLGTMNNPGNSRDCNGVMPDPSGCPPPFLPVNFIGPTYSVSNPLAGNPFVKINTVTGLISGRPNIKGQFVVGICVKEFRGSRILSVLRRDFQFNVTDCESNVIATVDADSVSNFGNLFHINLCGDKTKNLINLSPISDKVTGQSWTFDLGDTIVKTNERDFEVTFPDFGTYNGSLILNEGSSCTDTGFIIVNVYPFIKSDFTFEYDTCIAGPVEFTEFSTTGSSNIIKWNWAFGDGNFSNERNPNHVYMIPGNLEVYLAVEDVNRCKDTLRQPIPYFPVPPLLVIEPSTFIGCQPAEIFFDNLSFPIDSTYNIVWDFGDGQTSNDISPTHTYNDLGVFSVSVELTSPIGCFTSDFFPDWIRIIPSPQAGFSYTPEKLDNFNPTIFLTDESVDAVGWQWQFDDEGISLLQSPTYEFQDTGIQRIQQIVFHQNGCTDTAFAVLDVIPEFRYFLPNAFSPNFDGKNEVYKPKGFYEGITNYEMTIWSRWGELLFKTNDPNEGWNGRLLNTGEELPVGVYVAQVKFMGPRKKMIVLNEFATIVR